MDSWTRLARLIRLASTTRYKTGREFAAAAGVSTRTIEDLLAGKRHSYRPVTLHAVEAALGWRHGSIQRVLEGGKPRPETEPGLARIIDTWPRLSARDRHTVLTVVDELGRLPRSR